MKDESKNDFKPRSSAFKWVALVLIGQGLFVGGVIAQPTIKAYFADDGLPPVVQATAYDVQGLANIADAHTYIQLPTPKGKLSDEIKLTTNNGVY
jgi:hypothetical protein